MTGPERVLHSLLLGSMLLLPGDATSADESASRTETEEGDDSAQGEGDELASVKTRWGGDVRYFQFAGVEDSFGDQNAARGAIRLKLETEIGRRWRIDAHGLIEGASPPALGGGLALAGGRPTRFFDLDAELDASADQVIRSDVDRLSVRYEGRHLRVTVGRQAVTWGVNYFWPVLDLFAPFSPERIDRDYKPGVDAVRVTVPLGDFSEFELIGAVQGREPREDRSFGVLGRFHLGNADLGLMAGSFHRDTVLGAFLTGDALGSLLRAEISYTETSDRSRLEGDPHSFVRATAGVDRLLGPNTTLIFETTWNGYGVEDPMRIASLAVRERVRRGEITSFSELASGVTLGFRAHPLLNLSAAALVSWSDGSVLLQPSGVWSLSDNADALFGALVGLGDDESERGLIASEYGAIDATIWVAVRWAF